jgi:hypothetical protein
VRSTHAGVRVPLFPTVRSVGCVLQAEVLKLGRDKVQLTHVEFMDCSFGPPGERARVCVCGSRPPPLIRTHGARQR